MSPQNATPPGLQNRLLLALPPAERELLFPRLIEIEMPLHTILQKSDAPVERFHFVETGTVSMIAIMQNGTQIEVGLVGAEGVVGLPLFLGAMPSPLEGLVQVKGRSLFLPSTAFQAALQDCPSLSGLLLRYVDAFYSQVTQSAICNGCHQIEQRLARWVLMTHDRVDGEVFEMTQEFLSHMLGVQRPSVTLAVRTLSRAGLIAHSRRQMRILDRAGLEAVACECYCIVQQRYAWLMPPHAGKSLIGSAAALAAFSD